MRKEGERLESSGSRFRLSAIDSRDERGSDGQRPLMRERIRRRNGVTAFEDVLVQRDIGSELCQNKRGGSTRVR